jgi:hypothetical protein
MTAPVQLICMLVAAWTLWRRPAQRSWAAVVLAAPIVLLFAPAWLRGASDPPLFGGIRRGGTLVLFAAPLVVPLALCVFAPRSVAPWLPRSLVRSRSFHVALVTLGVLCWLAWIAGAVAYLRVIERDSSGILLGAFLAASALALLGWAAAALYSWVALFSRDDARNDRLRLAVIAIGLPAVALFVLGTWLGRFAGGPG